MTGLTSSRRLRGGRPSALGMLVGAFSIGVGLLVVVPIVNMVRQAFFSTSGFSNNDGWHVLADDQLPGALANTVVVTVVAGGAAVVAGSLLAWLNERTDARVGWVSDFLVILPLMVPLIAGAMGWVLLLSPRAGTLNILLRAILPGTDEGVAPSGPFDIYSLPGMIFVIGIYAVPLPYLVVSAALRNVDPALEEASRMCGSGTARTLTHITLPSVRGALATACVLTLMVVFGSFAVPVVIGVPANINVLGTLIYQWAFASQPPRVGDTIILGLFILVVVQVAVLVEYGVRRRGRYATIEGQARSLQTTRLGAWRWPVRAFMLVYIVLVTVLPMTALLLVSLQPYWSTRVVWSDLSLDNYRALFASGSQIPKAFEASLVLGAVCATVLILGTGLVEFYIARHGGGRGRLLNVVMTLPASLPHIVVGIALLVTLGVGEGRLGGTYLLILLAYVVMLVPQASRAAGAAVGQVGRGLWEASVVSGAGGLRTFVRILLPLAVGGLLAGWVVVFVFAFGEVTASMFLSTSPNPVVGPILLYEWVNSVSVPQVMALALLVTATQTAVVLVARLGLRHLQRGQQTETDAETGFAGSERVGTGP